MSFFSKIKAKLCALVGHAEMTEVFTRTHFVVDKDGRGYECGVLRQTCPRCGEVIEAEISRYL